MTVQCLWVAWGRLNLLLFYVHLEHNYQILYVAAFCIITAVQEYFLLAKVILLICRSTWKHCFSLLISYSWSIEWFAYEWNNGCQKCHLSGKFFCNKMYNLYINKSYKSCTLRDCLVDDGKFWSGLVDGTFRSFRFHSQLYI